MAYRGKTNTAVGKSRRSSAPKRERANEQQKLVDVEVDEITYIPEEGDPIRVHWNGIEFKAHMPTKVSRKHAYGVPMRTQHTLADGTIVTKHIEKRVTMVELAKGNPKFSVNGEAPAKKREGKSRVPTDSDEYRGYATAENAESGNMVVTTKDAEKGDWSKLIRAYLQLAQSVDHAFRQEPNLIGVEKERQRVAAAIICVARFFSIFRAPFAGRFFELGSAIAALNDGVQHVLLKPAHRNANRPIDPPQLWRARANVVLAFNALIEAGFTRDNAAKKIAVVTKLNKLVGKKFMNAARRDGDAMALSKTVVDWRKKFRSGTLKKNWEVDTFYEAGSELIEFMVANDKDRLVNFANAQLDDAVAAAKFFSQLTEE
jgi:hypothetical protein